MRDAVMEALSDHLYEEEMAEKEFKDSRPRCEQCGKPITDEYLYDIGGEILCQECMEEQYQKNVDIWIWNRR